MNEYRHNQWLENKDRASAIKVQENRASAFKTQESRASVIKVQEDRASTFKTQDDKSSEISNDPIDMTKKYLSGALQSRNVRIYNRRTSVRLEPEMWSALSEIANLEGCSIHDLCGAVYDMKGPGASFTAALRVFMMEYYRSVYRTNDKINLIQQKIRATHSSSKK